MSNKILIYILIPIALAVAGVVALITYLVSVLITGHLVVNLSLSLLAFGLVGFSLLHLIGGLLALNHPDRFAAILSLLSALTLVAVIFFPILRDKFSLAPGSASESVVSALREVTLPLDTVQAGNGFDDLQPLKPVLAGKRIIALGEATHGTSEFFKMKHRMLEFLVREMGYENFGMETTAAVAQVINDYISGGQGKPEDVLYWPWATVEVMDMLDWMRRYNTDASTTRKLTFHGIDPGVGDRDRVMADNVQRLLEQLGPESKIVLWAHNAHISNADGWMGHYLKQKFGDQAYLVGFEFSHGTFTSRMITVHTYSVGPASPSYYAYSLAKVGAPILFLDFKTMLEHAVLREWLEREQSSHAFQELHAIYRLNPAWCTNYTSWLHLYDGLIFVEQSTPPVDLR